MVIYVTILRDLAILLVVIIYVTAVGSETLGVENPGFGVKL